jgi:hypothetical protein
MVIHDLDDLGYPHDLKTSQWFYMVLPCTTSTPNLEMSRGSRHPVAEYAGGAETVYGTACGRPEYTGEAALGITLVRWSAARGRFHIQTSQLVHQSWKLDAKDTVF